LSWKCRFSNTCWEINRNPIVITIFRLIWDQTEFCLVLNQSENGKQNLISVDFTRIGIRSLGVWVARIQDVPNLRKTYFQEKPLFITNNLLVSRKTSLSTIISLYHGKPLFIYFLMIFMEVFCLKFGTSYVQGMSMAY